MKLQRPCEKLPRPPTLVYVNYCFSLRIQSFFTGSHKIQPWVEPIWMINICPWWWNSRYTFLESDSEISISESQIPASANLRAVHTRLKRYTFLEWGSKMSISESQIPISANCRLSILYTILDFKITPSNFTQTLIAWWHVGHLHLVQRFVPVNIARIYGLPH